MMRDCGKNLHRHVAALFPICRSITGDGLRQTLGYIAEHIPLTIQEVSSGTKVLDWEIPLEWNVRSAFIATIDGKKIVDFARHNLHLVQYSQPVDRIVPREELARHLYSLPDQPKLIPYRTAYYSNTWGFCLSHNDRIALTEPTYHVVIDSTLAPGSLSYGECLLRGRSEEEVLISVHSCHPSLANDNLSGIAVAIETARALAKQDPRYSYRFLFMPGTIGAVTWLARNRDAVRRIRYGLVLSCLGDSGAPSYKRSRQGNAAIDRYASYVLSQRGHAARIHEFSPYGYDERQYCSPGFDLPVGCLMRSPNGSFPEYHTSADSLDFVQPAALADSFAVLEGIVGLIERDGICRSTSPYGEPQLGRRGLYGDGDGYDWMSLLWVLNLADGRHSLLDMAERSGKPFDAIAAAATAAAAAGLLVREEAFG
jgi:aminopeptidase-like protein